MRIRGFLIPKTFPKNQNQRFFDFQIFKSPKEPEVIIKILKAWADLFFSVLVGQLTEHNMSVGILKNVMPVDISDVGRNFLEYRSSLYFV